MLHIYVYLKLPYSTGGVIKYISLACGSERVCVLKNRFKILVAG